MHRIYRFLVLLLVLALLITPHTTAYATVSEHLQETIEVELAPIGDGSFSGTAEIQGVLGATAVDFFLSEHGGINGLYTLHVIWAGTDLVSAIRASNVTLTPTSALYDGPPVLSQPFSVTGLSSASGTATISGSFYVDPSITSLHISLTNLQLYYYHTAAWLSIQNLSRILDCP